MNLVVQLVIKLSKGSKRLTNKQIKLEHTLSTITTNNKVREDTAVASLALFS